LGGGKWALSVRSYWEVPDEDDEESKKRKQEREKLMRARLGI